MTPSGIEPATFRFVAQHLNHCATAAPDHKLSQTEIMAGTSLPTVKQNSLNDVLMQMPSKHG